MSSRIDQNFAQACKKLLSCKGKVVLTGLGKSGHVGNKIAATLSSTGTPSFFMHPAEANHGDLGMLSADDVVVAISNSGETAEVLSLLPRIKRLRLPLIALTKNTRSSLGLQADIVLDISVPEEACTLGLAPTSSTTVSMVLGDALALTLLEAKQFTKADFLEAHPGGSLSRKLALRIQDVMVVEDAIPIVGQQCSITEALLEMSKKGLGFTAVKHDDQTLAGIFTDGDVRRLLDTGSSGPEVDVSTTAVGTVMTRNSITMNPADMAIEALNCMEQHKISGLIITDQDQTIIGACTMHMLLRSGIV